MAQKVETRVVDDLDGSVAAETVSFAFEGREYEIDLSQENAARLRDSLSVFVGAARHAGGGRRSVGARAARGSSVDREQTHSVREWARDNGFEVSSRGRIPGAVLEAYAQRASQVAVAPAKTESTSRPLVTDPFAVQTAS
nr:Lsr2 family protein [Pseudonocardia nigra]